MKDLLCKYKVDFDMLRYIKPTFSTDWRQIQE